MFSRVRVRPSSLQFPGFSFLPSLKTGVTLAFFQSSGTWRRNLRNSTISCALQLRQPLIFTSPSNYFFFVNIRSSRASPLISSVITCVRKLSKRHSRIHHNSLCPAVLPSQQISGCLNSTMRTWSYEHEPYSSCLKKASFTSFS